MSPFREEAEGIYCFALMSVGWSVDQNSFLIILRTVDYRVFIFHMLIGLGEEKTHIDFEFTGSKVTRVTYVKK